VTKTEYEMLNKAYPTAMSAWKDRMLEMDKGDILDRMIECMEGPLLGGILAGTGSDIIKSRENDDDL
jgi:hypothetical protein